MVLIQNGIRRSFHNNCNRNPILWDNSCFSFELNLLYSKLKLMGVCNSNFPNQGLQSTWIKYAQLCTMHTHTPSVECHKMNRFSWLFALCRKICHLNCIRNELNWMWKWKEIDKKTFMRKRAAEITQQIKKFKWRRMKYKCVAVLCIAYNHRKCGQIEMFFLYIVGILLFCYSTVLLHKQHFTYVVYRTYSSYTLSQSLYFFA